MLYYLTIFLQAHEWDQARQNAAQLPAHNPAKFFLLTEADFIFGQQAIHFHHIVRVVSPRYLRKNFTQ